MEHIGKDNSSQHSQVAENTIYLKALPLRSQSDTSFIRDEVKKGNIIIARIIPSATESIDNIKDTINELCIFIKDLGGDIARLGEERLVITPSTIKIWHKPSEI